MAATKQPGLLLNEDCNHFVYSRSPDEMTAEGVDALVDSYMTGTQVRDLIFNVNGMRSSVESRVKQTFWDGFDPEADNNQPYFAGVSEGRDTIRKWVGNMLLLHQQRIDPYARWLARSRKLGAAAWLSMRMNDIHCVNEPNHVMHDRIWREHPEYWRVTWREFESPVDRTLNWGEPAVRDYNLAYAREVIGRYDFDGFELDWVRDVWCFRAGEESTELLTEFTAKVRRLLDARAKEVGHPIRLGARIPSQPEAARRLGFDAAAWARNRLVDLISPSPGFGGTDLDVPVEVWKDMLHGTAATLAPGLEITIAPFPFSGFRLVTIEESRAAAAMLLDRGADRVYLFNYMDRSTEAVGKDFMANVLTQLGSLDTLADKPRSHVVSYNSTCAPGKAAAFPLPYRCSRYGYRPSPEFRVPIGPAPLPGQQASVRLGLEITDAPLDQGRCVTAYGRRWHFGLPAIDAALARQLIVRVQGKPCAFHETLPPRPSDNGPTHAWRVPAGALHRGDNVIEISNYTETPAAIVWVEIHMGDAEAQHGP